jgi:hypothetical protein
VSTITQAEPTSYSAEYLEARETLDLSARTASQFVAQLGALAPVLVPPLPGAHIGRRPGFQATVLDHKYWFAKLYQLVTIQELSYSIHTKYPGFSFHFVKVFYGMYFDALQTFLRGGKAGALWQTHFEGPHVPAGERIDPTAVETVQFSVKTGAIAHIQGDMPVALATAYKTWSANPKPAFDLLREDFIDGSQKAFVAAQAAFYLDVNDKTFSPLSPEVGQFAAAVYQQTFDIQPSLPVMFQWRRDAWQKAANSLH